MFTIDQIRCFAVVAEELHFGRAAERLQMTQPPLSRQIQRLERSLGIVLLEREHRGVRLTAAGAAFLEECRDILAMVERAPATARNVAAGWEGTLRVGFTAAAGFSVLGSLMTRLSESLPQVSVELSELVTSEQSALLLTGALDLGLARPSLNDRTLASRLILTEDLVLAVPSDHPLAERDQVVEEDLIDLPVIMHSPRKARYFYDLTMHLLPLGYSRAVHTVSQITTMVSLVSAGVGTAFVPASTRLLHVENVSYVSLGERGRDLVQLHAIWNRENRNPALRRGLALLGNAC